MMYYMLCVLLASIPPTFLKPFCPVPVVAMHEKQQVVPDDRWCGSPSPMGGGESEPASRRPLPGAHPCSLAGASALRSSQSTHTRGAVLSAPGAGRGGRTLGRPPPLQIGLNLLRFPRVRRSK